MKLSEAWLREWVNPPLSSAALCEMLIMAGLEVESLSPVAEPFSNVIVCQIVRVEKHPEADRLKVCQVDSGQPELLTIVCGAANARAGIKVPLAQIGAHLPNNIQISRSKIRNVVSHGMLCSAVELGLAEAGQGILELPLDAPIGQNVWDYFQLSDHVIDVSVTPNRGDCLSIKGLAREVAAVSESPLTIPEIKQVGPTSQDQLSIVIDDIEACPRYVGRVIRQIKADAITPIWMQERLRRSDIRSISAIVDIMNYVMLELGQPMHAFDLQEITGAIHIRKAAHHEKLTLLDGQTITLQAESLIIADAKKPLALAGIMGGLDSSVTEKTQDIFLESAYFNPISILKTVREFGINSDSSYRFERGIDPLIQAEAIERATALILTIAGGLPGPLIDVGHAANPNVTPILLRWLRLSKILGITLAIEKIESILKRLDFTFEKTAEGWQVIVPQNRPDLRLEIDLIEEVIRLYGYDRLPAHPTHAVLQMNSERLRQLEAPLLRTTLRDLGYHEVVTYSFIAGPLQQLFEPKLTPKVLRNPISSDMNVMRTSLWPGLVNTLLYNANRQQERVRLFEMGLRFIPATTPTQDPLTSYTQQKVLSGLASGAAFPEQWGLATRPIDFFDLKGDIEHILKLTGSFDEFVVKTGQHPATHPGQTGAIYRADRLVGLFGVLHPLILQKLDFTEPVLVFELLLDELAPLKLNSFAAISKFPEIRRDIAIFVDQSVPFQAIQDTIYGVGGELLRNVRIFDVYQGKGVAANRKSIALALTLQHSSRTLVDEEVLDVVDRVIAELTTKFAAELRG